MKRLWRIVLSIIMVISLVPCIAALVMWAEYGRENGTFYYDPESASSSLDIFCMEGNITLIISTTLLNGRDFDTKAPIHIFPSTYITFGTGDDNTSAMDLQAPLWSCAAITSPPMILSLAVATRASLRKRQSCRGRCFVCGYDLRATPDRCPECGTVPASGVGRDGG